MKNLQHRLGLCESYRKKGGIAVENQINNEQNQNNYSTYCENISYAHKIFSLLKVNLS